MVANYTVIKLKLMLNILITYVDLNIKAILILTCKIELNNLRLRRLSANSLKMLTKCVLCMLVL